MNTVPSARLHELIHQFSTAVLITFSQDDGLHARPMAIADVSPDNVLWFISARDSIKTTEIANDSRAHIICQSGNTFLSIQGEALLTEDPVRIAEVWNESFREWFPEGPNDENLILIVVRPSRAEYWDNTTINRMTYEWIASDFYAEATSG